MCVCVCVLCVRVCVCRMARTKGDFCAQPVGMHCISNFIDSMNLYVDSRDHTMVVTRIKSGQMLHH